MSELFDGISPTNSESNFQIPKSSTQGPEICLAMIVKNEAHVIERALKSAIPFITHYCIHDTGSTDNTKEIITRTMTAAGIPGHIFDKPWVNFGHNRSACLASVREMCPTGWAWVLDADDTLEGTPPPASFWETLPHTVNALRVRIHHGSLRHQRTQLFSSKANWVYKGAVHEWPACEGSPEVHATLPETTWHQARCEGARSQDPFKYVRDAFALRDELQRTPDEPRACFYLAQSYRDAGLNNEAIVAYKKRAELSTGFWQERYMSYVNLIKLTDDLEEKLKYAWLAIEIDRDRLEAPYYVMFAARKQSKMTQKIYGLAMTVENRQPRDSFLFIDSEVYKWCYDDELSILAYYTGHYKVALEAGERARKAGPPHMQPRLQANVEFARRGASSSP